MVKRPGPILATVYDKFLMLEVKLKNLSINKSEAKS